MAEAIALQLAKKIGDVLIKEGVKYAIALIETLQKIDDQLRDIKRRLEIMQAFLHYADKHSIDNKLVATWVKQVRELALQIEDVVDEYTYIMRPKKQACRCCHCHRCYYCCDCCGCLGDCLRTAWKKTKKMRTLIRISDQLQSFNNTLHGLWEDKNTFGIKADEESMSKSWVKALSDSQQQAESAHTIPDESFFGFAKEKKELIGWLEQDDKSLIFSVQGMPGAGKTTLVTNVYKHSLVAASFECRAWVSVSQNYNRDDLLRKIIRELPPEAKQDHLQNLESKRYTVLVEILQQLLQRRSCLIVLDDVWHANMWSEVRDALLQDTKKIRIIITTRKEEVARVADKSHTLELKSLDEAAAFDLFCHYAFRNNEKKDCQSDLKILAKKIANKCDRLPLALVMVGNILAQKNFDQWKNVSDMLSINGEMREMTELNKMDKILSLSISNLPSNVRRCFLYCSIFPEDYKIKRKTLLRLWVSEGFIVDERVGRSNIEVAEVYLNELINQHVLQVVDRNKIGQVKSLKVHDIVQDMIVEKQRNENFYYQWDGSMLGKPSTENVRCLSITKWNEKNNEVDKHPMTCLRSFHIFSSLATHLPVSNFKLLRVLNLDQSKVKNLPEDIDILFNLRYLSIRGTKIQQLPKKLHKLWNLECLDLLNSSVNKSPKGISKLDKLQHLMGNCINVDDVKNLWHLQTLKKAYATNDLLQDLGSLTLLRTLHIIVNTNAQSKNLASALAELKNIVTLNIQMDKEGNDYLELDDSGKLPSLPSRIRTLVINGPLDKGLLPQWLRSHSSLKYLKLAQSHLQDDPIPTLALPNLVYLVLESFCTRLLDKLCFPEGSFSQLKTCELNTVKVREIEISKESLVALETMSIRYGKPLKPLRNDAKPKTLPNGIEKLENLKELNLYYTSYEMVNDFNEQEVEKLKHIPLVKLEYKDRDDFLVKEVLRFNQPDEFDSDNLC